MDYWKSGRGARRATSAVRGGTQARVTCTLLFRNPGLILWGWCRCSIPCSASSAFHEPPYAEPHVRWCGRATGVIPSPTRLRPAGCTYLEVKVLYTLGKEKC